MACALSIARVFVAQSTVAELGPGPGFTSTAALGIALDLRSSALSALRTIRAVYGELLLYTLSALICGFAFYEFQFVSPSTDPIMQPPYYPTDPPSMMGPPGQGMPSSGPDAYSMPQQQMPMPAGYSDPYTENVGYGGGGGGAWGDGYYGGKGGGRETTSATGNGAGTGQAGENHGEQTFSGYSGGWGGASTGQMGGSFPLCSTPSLFGSSPVPT